MFMLLSPWQWPKNQPWWLMVALRLLPSALQDPSKTLLLICKKANVLLTIIVLLAHKWLPMPLLLFHKAKLNFSTNKLNNLPALLKDLPSSSTNTTWMNMVHFISLGRLVKSVFGRILTVFHKYSLLLPRLELVKFKILWGALQPIVALIMNPFLILVLTWARIELCCLLVTLWGIGIPRLMCLWTGTLRLVMIWLTGLCLIDVFSSQETTNGMLSLILTDVIFVIRELLPLGASIRTCTESLDLEDLDISVWSKLVKTRPVPTTWHYLA